MLDRDTVESYKSPDFGDDFRSWEGHFEENIGALVTKGIINSSQVCNLLDGGCGFGASTLALSRVFPQAAIHACSLGAAPTDEVKSEIGDRLHFLAKGVRRFLEETADTFDLLVLARPNMDITGEDYKLMADHIKQNGWFLGIPDNQFKRFVYDQDMQPFFTKIEVPPDLPLAVQMRLWQRK